MPRSFTSPNGFGVLVGKDRYENDELTFRIGKFHDFWFHAAGFAGSHVILQCTSDTNTPTNEDLQFAADLAAVFSKARNEKVAMVHVCRVGDVERQAPNKPGAVTCHSAFVMTSHPRLRGPVMG